MAVVLSLRLGVGFEVDDWSGCRFELTSCKEGERSPRQLKGWDLLVGAREKNDSKGFEYDT